MKLHRLKELEREIADKSAYLEKQRQLMLFERMQLKKVWANSLTSPTALLFGFSTGFIVGYLRKPKTDGQRVRSRFSDTRTKLQTAIFNFIKRSISGVVIGIVSSITAGKGGPISMVTQEE